MAGGKEKVVGSQQQSDRGHTIPRRTSPEASITLQNHRIGREPSRKPALVDSTTHAANSPRRDSSGESHDTGHSDPKNWFDQSNRNPTTYDAGCMDVDDPPFFQKKTSPNDEPRGGHPTYIQEGRPDIFRRTTQSSSAEDYRSVIDDLTIENKRLKEELKRYKQFGSDSMKKDKLFEIKFHSLTGWKKRELEATLRDFVANTDGGENDSRDSPTQTKNSARKNDSSTSSRSRPVDSAYASMSTGPSSHAPNSTGTSLRPTMGSRAKSSQQKVENYLRDTPDGLFPRHLVLNDKQKKKIVVRRLEQLFTGKIRGKTIHQNQSMPSLEAEAPSDPAAPTPMGPPRLSREALIQQYSSQKKGHSRDNFSVSNSNSNGDQNESGRESGGSGGRGGSNKSPEHDEQRPTRPLDLDPDRTQIPSDNLNYIKHLGMVPSEVVAGKKAKNESVSPDAEGWVYLNLLCNLAQLHIISVTPAFIRAAVSEMSTKFQLSPDGRKIRWRGGTTGTKFSSDSSGENSQKSPSTDDTDGSNQSGQRKRPRLAGSGAGTGTTGVSSKESKFGPQLSQSSNSFHYKPIFVHRPSSLDSSVIGTTSQQSDGGVEESNFDQWDYSGSGSSRRKRKRNDGAIIYYSGAPFCTDLSGDVGELSPTTYLQTSTGQEAESIKSPTPPLVYRTLSGSSLPIRPLTDAPALVAEVSGSDDESAPVLLDDDEEDSPVDEPNPFVWCDEPDHVQIGPLEPVLEPCGLGGVIPEDHFAVIVTTRRMIRHDFSGAAVSEDAPDAIISRLESLRTSSPLPPIHPKSIGTPIHMEYLTVRFQRSEPVPLPPPAVFFPPFSSDSDSGESEEEGDSFDEDLIGPDSTSGELFSQRVIPNQSDGDLDNDVGMLSTEEGVQVGSSDEEERLGEDMPAVPRRPSHQSGISGVPSLQSSVATAGGAESGYNSSMEDDSP